jgi:ABC-2 type transport system permease protein
MTGPRATEATTPVTRPARSVIAHQFRQELRRLLRNPQSRFFTLAMPVLLLGLFGSVFRHANVAVPGGRLGEAVYYTPAILAYGLVAAVFMDLAASVVTAREAGVYKRRRATPVSAGSLIGARALAAAAAGLAVVGVLAAVGWAAFGASIPAGAAGVLVLDLVVGTAAFCALGFAVATFIVNAEAAQPVLQAVVLPLCFISGVFIPAGELPHWLISIAGVFPVRALAAALLAVYNPAARTHLRIGDLAVLGAWAAAGAVIGLWRFRWLPHGSEPARPSSASSRRDRRAVVPVVGPPPVASPGAMEAVR